MKRIIIIALCLVTLQTVHAQDSMKNVKTIIQQLNKDMEDAFNKNDMMKVAAFYSEDAEITADNYNVQGKKNIDQYWAALKDKGRGWKLSVFEVGGQGEYVYQLGTSDLNYLNNKDKEQRSVINFILIWKLDKDNVYRIFRDYLTKTKFEKD